jgi:hypothetical protein
MNKLFRLTTIREVRVLTVSGWVVLLMTFGSILFSIGLIIHPFLSPTKPVGGDIFVVESLSLHEVKRIKEWFEKNPYKVLVTVGEKIPDWSPINEFGSMAHYVASKLNAEGVPLEKIIPVQINAYPRKDRTYYKALRIKERLNKMGFDQASIDVISDGTHARRSWLLFEKAFPSVDVGIIAIPPNRYDASKWWFYSAGVRNVISESIAYLYARFIFSPPSK